MSLAGYEQTEAKLRSVLCEKSFAHAQRTAVTAKKLALRHGCGTELCALAALAHDVARDMNDAELLEAAGRLDLPIGAVERKRPYLLHAAVGAGILSDRLGIEDDRVARAVERHTFGAPAMTDMEMIVFLADMIEPSRQFPGVDDLRELAERDLRAAYIMGFKRQLLSLIEMGRFIHPRTVAAWNGIAKEVRARA